MKEIAGVNPVEAFRQVLIQMVLVVNLVGVTEAQIYVPTFKSVEMQATIAPLGEMVAGNFSGDNSVAAICKAEKAIYFFEPDSMENLILTNVVSLPDTPIAISKGQEVILDTSDRDIHLDKLAVLMSRHSVLFVSFGKDGRPIVSQESPTDAYTTDIRTADLEAAARLDVITFGKFCLGVSVAKNMGGGELRETRLMQGPLGGIPFSSIAFTDFNSDQVPDMAALDWVNHRLLIFYGRGDGTFAQPVSFQLKAEPSTLAVADLTGNGYPDMLVGYTRVNQIDLYGGDGVGRFFLRQTLKTVGPVSKFVLADFTGNGTMDIAAFSSKAKQVTLFSFDLATKSFKYTGVIGVGQAYDDIAPFNFPHRFRADLVASSPSEKYIKVFKTSVAFKKYPEVHLPVSGDGDLMLAFGDGASNYVMVADSSGSVRTVHYGGLTAADADTVEEFQTEGKPASMKLIASDYLHLLLSYDNADMVSIYDLASKATKGRKVMTPYLPFLVDGTTIGDSAIIAAAYPMKSDSEIGISYFRSVSKESGDFVEKDYDVSEMKDCLSSALTLKDSSFIRILKNGIDTLTIMCTRLEEGKTVSGSVVGSDAKVLNSNEHLFLFVENDDTLTLFRLVVEKPTRLALHQMCMIPFDSSNFRSIHVAAVDSVFYVTFFDSSRSTVSLYLAYPFQLQFMNSWRSVSEPEDIAISTRMKRVYFLNRSESYVTVHSF